MGAGCLVNLVANEIAPVLLSRKQQTKAFE